LLEGNNSCRFYVAIRLVTFVTDSLFLGDIFVLAMDALFVPLASLVGASVDQVKVRRVYYLLTSRIEIHMPSVAHNVSFNCLPSRKSLHSPPILTTGSETSIQHIHRTHLLYLGS
jgi:hypothetical protein